MAAENSFGPAIKQAEDDIEKIKIKIGEVGETVAQVSKDIRSKLGKAFKIQANNDLVALVEGQKKLIGELNKKLNQQIVIIGELKQKKAELNKITGQEKVNNRELAKNVDLHAKSVSKLVGTMGNLIAQRKKAKKVLQDELTAEKQNIVALKKAQKEYDRLSLKINRANKATSNFSKTGLGGAVRGIKNLLSAFGLISGVTLFAAAIKSAFNLTKTLDSLRFSMAAVITDTVELAKTQTFLKQITQDYGAELVTVTNRYIKFRAAAQQAGLTAQETQNIFSTMTKAAGVLGLKKDELQGIFLALEQMVSKGKVTTEELRRQLGERLPGAMDIMATSLGVTTSQLDEMLKKGEVITKEVLPGFARQVEVAFGLENVRKVETLQAATTRLGNAWTILVEDFNKGNDSSGKFMKVLDFLANNLKTIIGLVLKSIGVFVAYKAVMIAVRIQATLLSKAFWGNTVALIQLRLGAIKAAFSIKALTAAMRANAILLFAAVIAGLVIAFKDWGKSALEAAKALNKVTRETTDQAKATRDLDIETTKLIKRYEELKKQTTLSWEEQKELKKIIAEIGKAFPQATISVDKYGQAIEISTEKAKELIAANKELAKLDSSIIIEKQTKSLKKLKEEQKNLNDLREEGTVRSIEGLGTVIRSNGEILKVINSRTGATKALSLEEQRTFLLYEQNLKEAIKLSGDLIVENEDIVDSFDPLNTRLKLQADELERIKKAQEKPDEDKSKFEKDTVGWLKEQIKANNALIELSKDRTEIVGIQEINKGYEDQIKLLLGVEEARKKGLKALQGSVAWLKKQVSILEDERNKLADNSHSWNSYTGMIEEAKEKLKEFQAANELMELSNPLDAIGPAKVIDEIDFSNAFDSYNTLQDLAQSAQEEAFDDMRDGIDGLAAYEDKKREEKATKDRIAAEQRIAIMRTVTDAFSEYYDIDFERFTFLMDGKDNSVEQWADATQEASRVILQESLRRYDIELQEALRSRDLILDNERSTDKEKEIARRKFEVEQRAIKTKRAKAERDNALIQIAIDTAAGVAKTIAFLGFPLAIPMIAVATGVGLAQAAIVASQPLPKFAEGTDGPLRKDTLAVVGDGGKQEYLTKNGQLVGITPDKSTLANLSAGTEVHKDQDSFLNAVGIDSDIFNMNMALDGRSLSVASLYAVSNEIGKLRSDNRQLWGEVKKIAKRPIHVDNRVVIEQEYKEYR